MIYPRLKIAKDLLTDDGVIFISIDDNELENIKSAVRKYLGKQFSCQYSLETYSTEQK